MASDSAESWDRERLIEHQARRLTAMLGEILPRNAFYAEKFRQAGLGPDAIRSPEDLDRLPFTTKAELLADQEAHPPYGTNLTYELTAYTRLHQTSGTHGRPLRWLDTPASWSWILDCWGMIYRAIGLRPEDRLIFPFSFGPFLGFWAAFDGAVRRGNLCLAAGGMTSGARLDFLAANRATIVACTPSYALRLAEVAAERGQDLAASPVRALVVAGEPGGSVPEIKHRIETLWGARCIDHTGMTEIGSLGIECLERPGGVHLLESECIAEVLDPQTGRPVSGGDMGELVLTNLGRWGSPLVRYRTGDLVRPRWTGCDCGRQWVWLDGGILGRIDDMVVVRGSNLYPGAVEAVIRRFDQVAEYRVEVRRQAALATLHVDLEPTTAAAGTDFASELVRRVQAALRDTLGLRADVTAVPPGSLPRFELKARRFVRYPADSPQDPAIGNARPPSRARTGETGTPP